MRDIVTKVDTAPKPLHHQPSIKTKTKYKTFEDYAKMHRGDSSVDESESCSATSYMLKTKFKPMGSDLDFDRCKINTNRYQDGSRDDQESVGSDDSGVGSISETKDASRYASYNEFLSGYRKKPPCDGPNPQKKVVRSEIYIQVGDAVDHQGSNKGLQQGGGGGSVKEVKRQFSFDGFKSNASSTLSMGKLQNFNSVPRRFEPASYPKPEVAKSLVRPVAPPLLLNQVGGTLVCKTDREKGVNYKPFVPPAPQQLKTNLRSPLAKQSFQISSNSTLVERAVLLKQRSVEKELSNPVPHHFMSVSVPEVKNIQPANRLVVENETSAKKEVVEESIPLNPMQLVFDEIKKRNPCNSLEESAPKTVAIELLNQEEEEEVKDNSCSIVPTPNAVQGIPPPPPPPMMPQSSNGGAPQWKHKPSAAVDISCGNNQLKTVQQVEKERPAPPPLQQELFKKLSERSKKTQNNEVVVESKDICESLSESSNKCARNANAPLHHQQKYNTLSRFMETEKECLLQQQQQQQQPLQCGTLDRHQDPKKKIVYNVYREMLGSYNAKANGILATMPSRMVREDQGVKKQLESL